MVKKGKRFNAQLKLFAKHFKPFIDKKIKEAIEPYETIHGCIDDMKCRVNERLRKITSHNLARIKEELERSRANIMAMQSHQTLTFSVPDDVE